MQFTVYEQPGEPRKISLETMSTGHAPLPAVCSDVVILLCGAEASVQDPKRNIYSDVHESLYPSPRMGPQWNLGPQWKYMLALFVSSFYLMYFVFISYVYL